MQIAEEERIFNSNRRRLAPRETVRVVEYRVYVLHINDYDIFMNACESFFFTRIRHENDRLNIFVRAVAATAR